MTVLAPLSTSSDSQSVKQKANNSNNKNSMFAGFYDEQSWRIFKGLAYVTLILVVLEVVCIVALNPNTPQSPSTLRSLSGGMLADSYSSSSGIGSIGSSGRADSPWADWGNARALASANDDEAYYNPNDKYKASQFVEYGHKFTGMKFEATEEYIMRVLYAPVITFGLGFLAIFLLHFGLLCRCCFNCCKCLPDTESSHFDRNRFLLTCLFLILCLLVVIIDMLVFLGNQSLDKGVKTIKGEINSLNKLLNMIKGTVDALTVEGDDLSDAYSAARTSCVAVQAVGDYSSYISIFTDAMDIIGDAIPMVTDKLDLVEENIGTYGIFYRNIGLYVIWGLALVCVLFFLLAKCCHSMGFMKFGIFFATVTYLLYLILGVPWLLLTSLFGDLCLAPTKQLVTAIPQGDLRNITSYYTTCYGRSYLAVSIDKGTGALDQLYQGIEAARPFCQTDVNLNEMNSTLTNIDYHLGELTEQIGCTYIQPIWFNVVNEGFCTQLYEGIFYIWGSQLVTSFLLFWLIVLSSIVYQYFDSSRVSPDEDDEDDDEEEDVGKSGAVQMTGAVAIAHPVPHHAPLGVESGHASEVSPRSVPTISPRDDKHM